MRRALLTAGIAAIALFTASPVAANGPMPATAPPRLGIRPLDQGGPYLTLTLRPGEQTVARVALTNGGQGVVTARTYAATAYTLVNGGFGARLAGQPTVGTAMWLEYPTEEVDLAPGAELVRSLAVAVPRDATPGEYVAALVVEPVKPTAVTGSPALLEVERHAIAVAILVPGPAHPALRIKGIAHAYVPEASVLTITISNPGNRHLRPTGTFRLVDAGGAQLDERRVAMDTVYAGTTTVLEVRLARLPPGSYVASLTLADGPTQADAPRLPFTVGLVGSQLEIAPAPVWWSVVGVAFLGLVALVLMFVRSTRRQIHPRRAPRPSARS